MREGIVAVLLGVVFLHLGAGGAQPAGPVPVPAQNTPAPTPTPGPPSPTPGPPSPTPSPGQPTPFPTTPPGAPQPPSVPVPSPTTRATPAPQPPPLPQQPGQPGQQPVSPDLTLIVPGKSIAGITIGQPLRSVVLRFGPASETRPLGSATVYVFEKFGLTVRVEAETVRAIATGNSIFRTREGTGVGSSVDEVTRAYGTQFASREVEELRGVAYDGLGIAFGVQRQSVAVVLVYAR